MGLYRHSSRLLHRTIAASDDAASDVVIVRPADGDSASDRNQGFVMLLFVDQQASDMHDTALHAALQMAGPTGQQATIVRFRDGAWRFVRIDDGHTTSSEQPLDPATLDEKFADALHAGTRSLLLRHPRPSGRRAATRTSMPRDHQPTWSGSI